MRPLSGVMLFGITVFCFSHAGAQQAVQHSVFNVPVAIFGVQTGVYQSVEKRGFNDYYGNTTSYSEGAFFRYYTGKHFAVETGLDCSFSETGFTQPQYSWPYSLEFSPYNRKVNVRTFDVPVQVQYHIGKKGSRLRPYFGAGIGYAWHSYTITENFINIRNNDVFGGSRDENDQSLFASVSQGLSYRLSSRFVLNESVFYQLDDKKNDIGLRIGIGWLAY